MKMREPLNDDDYVTGRAGMLDDPDDYIVHAAHGHVNYDALLGSSYEPVCYLDVVSWDDSALEAQQQAAKLEICGALESLLTLDYDEFMVAAAIWQNKMSIDGSNLSLVAKKLKRSRQSLYRLLPKIIQKAPILQFLVGDYEQARKADNKWT